MVDTDHDKIIRVEEKVGALSDVVFQIRDNHLAHLKISVDDLTDKVNSLDIKIATYMGAAGVLIWLANKFL